MEITVLQAMRIWQRWRIGSGGVLEMDVWICGFGAMRGFKGLEDVGEREREMREESLEKWGFRVWKMLPW